LDKSDERDGDEPTAIVVEIEDMPFGHQFAYTAFDQERKFSVLR
jgi:hypothetical protein